MRYEIAVRDFETIYMNLYLNKVDYWIAQEAWERYKDELCKNEEITQKEYDTWKTPFPYGKNLKPSYKQIAMANDMR